jgi:hypothetical protein
VKIDKQILKNAHTDGLLSEKGYVVIPFLSKEEVDHLVSFFLENHSNNIHGFYATAHVNDIEFRQKMNLEIRKVFDRAITQNFQYCRPLGGSFIVKSPNSDEKLQPHQDWNIVDEELFRSFNIWVPLVDLNDENGVIYVLPESHNWIRGYRHSSIPCVYGKVYEQVWENMIPLYMKAGEALIYDHSLVHASAANKSSQIRIACAYGIISEDAEMRYYWNNDGIIEEFEATPEFFMTQNVFTGPQGLRKLNNIKYDLHQLTKEEFYEISGIEKSGDKSELQMHIESGIWNKIKNLLK